MEKDFAANLSMGNFPDFQNTHFSKAIWSNASISTSRVFHDYF